ncbi:hypothetical protein HYH03_009027 [Edaphochlamys debaryana]|uniref:Uncharacterized protein n=1 Tax=Edaphochlamys debaryana TaxID=47281 RepID=A0A836BXD0_9CHLO|nr:hypothetical protein HYH03_009027 [Edaphochlamys debaryana]|eukprot:KAG2492611.1 hypothetical protein HYH03_009027 [Edaphochlamys debaryana]
MLGVTAQAAGHVDAAIGHAIEHGYADPAYAGVVVVSATSAVMGSLLCLHKVSKWLMLYPLSTNLRLETVITHLKEVYPKEVILVDEVAETVTAALGPELADRTWDKTVKQIRELQRPILAADLAEEVAAGGGPLLQKMVKATQGFTQAKLQAALKDAVPPLHVEVEEVARRVRDEVKAWCKSDDVRHLTYPNLIRLSNFVISHAGQMVLSAALASPATRAKLYRLMASAAASGIPALKLSVLTGGSALCLKTLIKAVRKLHIICGPALQRLAVMELESQPGAEDALLGCAQLLLYKAAEVRLRPLSAEDLILAVTL